MKFLILSTIAVAVFAGTIQAEEKRTAEQDSTGRELSVHFKCARAEILPEYKGNKEILDSITSTLATRLNSGDIPKINIIGAASPEGGKAYNYNLSKRRAQSISDYISRQINYPDTAITFTYLGRDWNGLKRYVESDSKVPEREAVLSLLDNLTITPTAINEEHANSQSNEAQDGMISLKRIGNGTAYRYLFESYFPSLRATRVSIPAIKLPKLEGLHLCVPDITATPTAAVIEIIPINSYGEKEAEGRPFYMALKTNMLLDAALIPSIGAEFYLGKNISIVGNWAYGWWDKDKSHLYWRYYGGDLAARWWFGKEAERKPLTGHHLGVYGGVFTYDFELGDRGYMGGKPGHWLWDRCVANVGVEYGYSLPIVRRLNIDFTIGLGYIWGKYIKYHPMGNVYVYDSIHKLRWFGPSKAEISLVWLLGRGNENRKGGAR